MMSADDCEPLLRGRRQPHLHGLGRLPPLQRGAADPQGAQTVRCTHTALLTNNLNLEGCIVHKLRIMGVPLSFVDDCQLYFVFMFWTDF